MPIPFLPNADFSIYSDDQASLEKGETNGLYLGVLTTASGTFQRTAIMAWYTPKNVHPKAVGVKGTTTVNFYGVCNIRDNASDVYTIEYFNVPPEEGYRLFMHPLTSTYNDLYYCNLGTVDLDSYNNAIPVYDTFSEALDACDAEGWEYVNPDNPYEFDPDSISYSGGGNGNFDNTSDTIGVPALPTLSAVSAGFVTMYNPTVGQLNALANFLWTDNAFDPANFKKLFTDPMECMIGLTIVPVAPTTSGSTEITVGYVGTGVSASKLSSQYAEVNCGTIQATEFWGSALDYSPNTRLHLYLPYVGIREISADEVMGRSIGVTYHVDLLSGALTSFVTANGSVLYQFNGQCALNIPMASSNFTQMIQGAISAIGSVASTVATSGASVGMGMALSATQIGASAANNAISNKPTFSHSGSMGGSGGMLGVQTPYLIIERPRQSMPEGMNKFCGFPSNVHYKLNDLTGYTQVEYIHIEGVSATGEELSEIERLLKEGVIL